MQILTVLYCLALYVASFIAATYLNYIWAPRIKRKITLWFMAHKIRRMAKKYPGEHGDKLKEVAKVIIDILKNED
jgi:hypothetical protein